MLKIPRKYQKYQNNSKILRTSKNIQRNLPTNIPRTPKNWKENNQIEKESQKSLTAQGNPRNQKTIRSIERISKISQKYLFCLSF